jgi:hypothetical protein
MRLSLNVLVICLLFALCRHSTMVLGAEPASPPSVTPATSSPRIGKLLTKIILFIPKKIAMVLGRVLRFLTTGKWSPPSSVEKDLEFPYEEAKEAVIGAVETVKETAQAVQEAVEETVSEVVKEVQEAVEDVLKASEEEPEIIEQDEGESVEEEE